MADLALDLFEMEAEDKLAKGVANQITDFNVYVQGTENNILKYTPGCVKGWLGKPVLEVPDMYSVYRSLYDYLKRLDVIHKDNIGWTTWFTASRPTEVNKVYLTKLTKPGFQDLIKKDTSADIVKLKTCYNLNSGALYNWLIKYEYNAKDEFELFPKNKQEPLQKEPIQKAPLQRGGSKKRKSMKRKSMKNKTRKKHKHLNILLQNTPTKK